MMRLKSVNRARFPYEPANRSNTGREPTDAMLRKALTKGVSDHHHAICVLDSDNGGARHNGRPVGRSRNGFEPQIGTGVPRTLSP